jgi:hypothetical protein
MRFFMSFPFPSVVEIVIADHPYILPGTLAVNSDSRHNNKVTLCRLRTLCYGKMNKNAISHLTTAGDSNR